MSSKRAQKARKRAQRQASKRARRQVTSDSHPTPSEPFAVATSNPLIGYLVHDGVATLCDGDGCIRAGSRDRIRQIRDRFGPRFAGMKTIQPAPFSDIWTGMRRGGAYCFDEEAYGRFLEPSRRVGMTLTDEDFSDPGPLGMHFVRVQLLNVDR